MAHAFPESRRRAALTARGALSSLDVARRGRSNWLVFVLTVALAWTAQQRAESRREARLVEALQTDRVEVTAYWTAPFVPSPEPFWDRQQTEAWWRRALKTVLGPRVWRIDLRGPKATLVEEIFGRRNERLIDLAPLAEFRDLREVMIHACQDVDLAPLAGLPLTELRVIASNPRDLSPLTTLHQLESLELGGFDANGLPPLAELRKLQRLDLSYAKMRDLKPFVGLDRLEVLRLHSSEVRDLTPLARLKRLKELHDTRVRDLSPLKELKALRWLWTSGSRVTREEKEALQRALPECNLP